MAVQTSISRTSPEELQLSMDYPSKSFIRHYASEVFGDQTRAEDWLRSQIPALANATPESLLNSGSEENLRRVLVALVQIDYGVVA